jgi:hypothetical protein
MFNCAFLRKWFGTMCRREGHGRELWIINLAFCGVPGVLLNPWAAWGRVMEEYQGRVVDVF